jgi:IPT/TIG domain
VTLPPDMTVPADTHTWVEAIASGFYGERTDPMPDWLHMASGGAGAQRPQLTALQPQEGDPAGGTTLNLGGTGLTGTLVVTVGQERATSFAVVDDTKVTAVTPPGEGSGLTIAVANAAGFSDLYGIFSYVEPEPEPPEETEPPEE